jgi:hypothetical protein
MNEIKPPDAESIAPPAKSFITQEQMEEIWDARGLKYRVDEFHQMLLDRGLGNYIDQPAFRGMFKAIVQGFLVEGDARRDPRRVPRQRFPKVH